MEIKSEIDAVLKAHAAWRERFKDILNGRTAFDLATISATDQCFFGQWLVNEGQRMVPPDLHAEITAVHDEFHAIASGIILKIKEKRFAEAKKDIALDGALNQTSLRLKSLVVKIRFQEQEAAALQPPENTQQAQVDLTSNLHDTDNN